MSKITKAILIIVGVMLSLPPYITAIATLLGAHITDNQGAASVSLIVVSVSYWIVVGLIMAGE